MAGHKPWSEIKHKRDEPKPADAPSTDSDPGPLGSKPSDDLGSQYAFENIAGRRIHSTAPRESEEDRRSTSRGPDRRTIEPEPISTHWTRKQADAEHTSLSTQYTGRSSGGHKIRYRVRRLGGWRGRLRIKSWGVYSS